MTKSADDWQTSYQQARIAHWDAVARQMDTWSGWGGHYHRRLEAVYRFLVTPGQRVLEVGCGQGDLLAALEPSLGVGVDFSLEMISRARQRHPQLRFVHGDAHVLTLDEEFDVIILSDLVNELWDIQTVFECLLPVTSPRTRIILNTYSRLWEPPMGLAARLGLAKPTLHQNWLTVEDVRHLLYLANFEVIRTWQEFLWPFATPGLDPFFNRFLVKIWPFNHLALTNFLLARPQPRWRVSPTAHGSEPLVSVIVPARNEEGNIPHIFDRSPEMGQGTELIFVEGHSRDGTRGAIERQIAMHPERHCRLLKQAGKGKGDAVRLGLSQANGDILMILDADLTVPPEDLPRFYEALCSGRGEFINGVRLVYPMQDEAMRFANLVGNRLFSHVFSWLLGQSVKDTLCGTKVLWKRDYELIAANRAYFGDFDPFGDFDLLFGAAKLGLKILDLPVRYRGRTYGTTNIHRWKHGWVLWRMVLFAAWRIKLV